ncbi:MULTISPECIES: DUF6663 family protein [Saliphagus]|uniref:DUF6663 family protein n=1 Tax=Saliphagus infecundisoli TaxID=1849069 RepID=A0ABD5QCQ7_9EURY|nr:MULTISPECIES: DUF6663 family protein [Saliphagus]
MAATEGRFRVLPGRDDDEWLLLDVESADPTYVPRESAPDLASGNRIEATLDWSGDEPAIADWTVLTDTRFRFLRTREPIFEAAETCFEAARSAGDAMNARVTQDTDGRANGVVYTFADQSGQRDLFAEFRDGEKPIEPLVARAAEDEEPPFSVWVIDPEEPFVVVFIVLDPEGLLAETMAETYL